MLAIQSRDLLDQGINMLEGFPVPALLIAGELEDEDDEAAAIAASILHGENLRIAGLDHGPACAASQATIPTARAFLRRWYN